MKNKIKAGMSTNIIRQLRLIEQSPVMQTCKKKIWFVVSLGLVVLIAMSATSFAQLYGIAINNKGQVKVPSPDKEWVVSVNINTDNVPMLRIQGRSGDHSEELMGVSRSGWILWASTSKVFAFTDAAFSDHYMVNICSVESERVFCQDISPDIEKMIREQLATNIEIDKLYIKALKWRSQNILTVGVHTVTSPVMIQGDSWVPVQYSFGAYWVDARTGRIIKKLTKKEARTELGANLDQLEW